MDPLERFIQELDDLASMDGPDISAALADLPVPQRGDVPTIEAVEVCSVTYYIIWYMLCDMCLPRQDTCREQDSTAFTKSDSERILMDCQKPKTMSAEDIKDLIQDVLHNEFDPYEVDSITISYFINSG